MGCIFGIEDVVSGSNIISAYSTEVTATVIAFDEQVERAPIIHTLDVRNSETEPPATWYELIPSFYLSSFRREINDILSGKVLGTPERL